MSQLKLQDLLGPHSTINDSINSMLIHNINQEYSPNKHNLKVATTGLKKLLLVCLQNTHVLIKTFFKKLFHSPINFLTYWMDNAG